MCTLQQVHLLYAHPSSIPLAPLDDTTADVHLTAGLTEMEAQLNSTVATETEVFPPLNQTCQISIK